MNKTTELRKRGQSLWLDHITRGMLDSGTLRRYIDELSVTGLTSNPTIFDEAIGKTNEYDRAIREHAGAGVEARAQAGEPKKITEALFIELALEDLRRAADLFRPTFDVTDGVDGWVSMEVSPLLANDSSGSIAAAEQIHRQANRPNLFVKIPGTPAGLPAIEQSIFAGIPINVTLLFSREQYLAAAEAYVRGVERRVEAGLDPRVASVASLFVSRWDKAVSAKVPAELRNQLGVAIGARVYAAYRELLVSSRWRKLADVGARPQRLLWASTGTKDPSASDTLYVEALASPDTIDTMPEKTLLAFADHGQLGVQRGPNLEDAERLLSRFAECGIDVDALATQLQQEGADSFAKSWRDLMQKIATKSASLVDAGARSKGAPT